MSGDDRGAGPAAEYELVVGSLDLGKRHVDDEVFPQYVREVRQRFLRERVGETFGEYGRPVVSLELDFHAELFAGDRPTATVELADVGETSITTEVELARDGEPVATARTVQVTVDLETGEKVPVPEAWREGLLAEPAAGLDD